MKINRKLRDYIDLKHVFKELRKYRASTKMIKLVLETMKEIKSDPFYGKRSVK